MANRKKAARQNTEEFPEFAPKNDALSVESYFPPKVPPIGQKPKSGRALERPKEDLRRATQMRDCVLEALRGSGTNSATAARVGISDRTLSNWITRGDTGEEPYATFVAEYLRALHSYVARVEGRLDRAGEAGDTKANIHLLDRADKRLGDPVREAYEGMTPEEFITALGGRPEYAAMMANQPAVIELVLQAHRGLPGGDE